ncbi:MAG: hypothetical protein GY856_14600 [bacterium]|nr:hypothetical protein [bacterium]
MPEPAEKRRRAPAKPHRDPDDVDPAKILAVLRRHKWMVSRAAEELGMARASLYKWMDRSPDVRKASDLSREEIERAFEDCGGHLDTLAGVLEVSKQALKQRMTKLGLPAFGVARARGLSSAE